METDDYKIFVVKIDRVEKHPNADRLDLVHVRGWQCVAQKGAFHDGELAVYIPIDSVLPPALEAMIFPEGSKIKLTKSRVKTIKIRGAISQGMVLSLIDMSHHCVIRGGEGFDLTEDSGITHYEPPAPEPHMQGNATSNKKKSPFFPVYSKISHFKNYPDLFTEGEQVIVTEKIHGTNFRAGWVPTQVNTFWKKVKRLFHLLPDYEFVYGSHQVQLQDKKDWTGFYTMNVYEEAVQKYQLKAKIPLGMVIYGEIYGGGIQKGYTYGLDPHKRELAIFDALFSYVPASDAPSYLSWNTLETLAAEMGVPTVPVIYRGAYEKLSVSGWEAGPSSLGGQPHREGVVIKPEIEQATWIGRKVLRSINPEYLLKAESDFH